MTSTFHVSVPLPPMPASFNHPWQIRKIFAVETVSVVLEKTMSDATKKAYNRNHVKENMSGVCSNLPADFSASF